MDTNFKTDDFNSTGWDSQPMEAKVFATGQKDDLEVSSSKQKWTAFDAPQVITGVAAPTEDSEKLELTIVNVGANDVQLNHDDAASAYGNRFYNGASAPGSSVTIGQYGVIKYVYIDQPLKKGWWIIDLF